MHPQHNRREAELEWGIWLVVKLGEHVKFNRGNAVGHWGMYMQPVERGFWCSATTLVTGCGSIQFVKLTHLGSCHITRNPWKYLLNPRGWFVTRSFADTLSFHLWRSIKRRWVSTIVCISTIFYLHIHTRIHPPAVYIFCFIPLLLFSFCRWFF